VFLVLRVIPARDRSEGACPSSASDAILVAGATGFVGMAVLARLTERTERRVLALVRAGSQAEADARVDGVMASLLAATARGDPAALLA
jgi:nucleoside-diphosphate-sugar epimerase